MADATIFDSSSASAPRLHILHLPAAINEYAAEKQDFRTPWFIDDENRQATPSILPPARKQEEHASYDETLSWKGLRTNDLMYFPDQLAGAGEFEGCRFVGERTDQGFLLVLSAGIESPIFPAQLVAAIGNASKLRVFYEKLFEIVLEEQHVSLVDIFGGQDVVEEFWSRPDTSKDGQSRRREDTADSTPWLIPLRQCTWLATMDTISPSSTGLQDT
jgi:hypothetical protein